MEQLKSDQEEAKLRLVCNFPATVKMSGEEMGRVARAGGTNTIIRFSSRIIMF